MKSYEELEVWQKGIALTEAIYLLTSHFPSDEKFGLTSQMRRAAVSIPSNIAEGWGRGPGASNASFVRIARGSLYELKTLVVVASKLGLVPGDDKESVSERVEGMRQLLHAYLKSIEVNVVREAQPFYGSG